MDKIKLLKNGVSKEKFLRIFQKDYPGFDFESMFDVLKFQGLPLIIKDEKVFLKTALISFKDTEYVVVDIEVNNSKPQRGQVIEIGAVKIKNLKITDSFDFLIYADDVPVFVERVTGISQKMLENEMSHKQKLKNQAFFGRFCFCGSSCGF
ncbi:MULTISPECIES: exonuclease domain-containing protein [unclassified Lebetimonas]|uniref:exonuclease domain-containing protein n=1 Tax=unclassified Lebetimonas TaxID=2648158 RepID=UPI0004B96F9E|nr:MULTISPECIES: exonuclease domain-containing protein [unclassified Lebetimonas]